MQEQTTANDRWRQLVQIQDGVEVTLPRVTSRLDGEVIEISNRTVSFAKALAISDGWSGISDARRRHGQLAA